MNIAFSKVILMNVGGNSFEYCNISLVQMYIFIKIIIVLKLRYRSDDFFEQCYVSTEEECCEVN